MLLDGFKVNSPNVQYNDSSITSSYAYQHTEVERTDDGNWVLTPQETKYEFKTDTKVPKLG